MSRAKLALYWRNGWHVLGALLLFCAPMWLVASIARQLLPDILWLRLTVVVVLVVFVAPVSVWAGLRSVFPGLELNPTLSYVVAASFPDEYSARIAVSALEQAGIHAAVEAGQSLGLPRSLAGVKVLVPRRQAAEAQALLSPHQSRSTQ